jgi:hypothetical protein
VVGNGCGAGGPFTCSRADVKERFDSIMQNDENAKWTIILVGDGGTLTTSSFRTLGSSDDADPRLVSFASKHVD